MTRPAYTYQASTALHVGKRENQEDAIATDFAIGEDTGFAVLSDGMGGHNAGEVASKLVVTEVFSELKLHNGRKGAYRGNVRDILLHAAELANTSVADVANGAPEAQGMGATLIVPVFTGDQLHWLSIGDSPLYLYRKGHLRQLNEDHSMAPHIDLMVRSGILAESIGRDHPDRNCLTSVLVGRAISKIDCPEDPTQLFDGDIVIAASDGVQSLPHAQMRDTIKRHERASSDQIAEELMQEILAQNDPEQDNICFAIVKVRKTHAKTHRPKTPVKHGADDLVLDGQLRKLRKRRIPKLHASLARLLPATPGHVK